MTVNIDELGPVDWIVVEFRGSKFTGDIAPILKDYVDRGLIRILDLLFLRKDDDGNLEAFETVDLDDSEIGELRSYETALAMLLSEQDVADLAADHRARQYGGRAGVGEHVGRAIRRSGTARRWPPGRERTHPYPSRDRRHRSRRRGRKLTCHLQPDAGAGPLPPSAAPLSSRTASTAAGTAARTAVTTAATTEATAGGPPRPLIAHRRSDGRGGCVRPAGDVCINWSP